MKTSILVIACGLFLAVSASADEADDLAPFLDETVFAVARIDLERLEPAEFAPYLQTDAEVSRLSESLTALQQMLRDLGVARVFAVYSFRDIGQQMPYLIIPAPDTDRAQRIAAYFYTGDPDGPTSLDLEHRAAATRMFQVAEPIGSTVFCGTDAARRRLDGRQDGRIVNVDNRTRTVWINLGQLDNLQIQTTFSVYTKEAGRSADDVKAKIEVTRVLGPHIAEARVLEEDPGHPVSEGDRIYSPLWSTGRDGLAASLAVAGNSSVSFVVAPTHDQRRVVAEMFPTLPAEAGGLSGAEIADGLQWIAAGVDGGAGLTAVTVEASNEDFAIRLSKTLPFVLGEFLPGPIVSAEVDGRRVILGIDSMESASALASTLVGSLARAGRSFDSNQSLKQLALAMHSFHDRWGGFSPPASYDDDGRPLLSWRVHLLPYLEAADLYEQFHLDEPWDSPHNRELIALMPDVFRSNDISLSLDGKTRYLLPIAEKTPWHGQVGTMIRELTDGSSNTIMIVEADRDRAVVWTQPVDLPVNWDEPQDGLAGDGIGFRAAFCDGSSIRIRADIDPDALTLLLQYADGKRLESGYDIRSQD